MAKLNGKAFELVTNLADLGETMEHQFSSFEISDRTIDLVNGASCFIQEQDSEIKRLREALEYYADKKHYEPYCLAVGDYASDVTEDNGMIARIASEGDSNT